VALGKKTFSSFGDFFLKMKLFKGGFVSYCYCETKSEYFPQLPPIIKKTILPIVVITFLYICPLNKCNEGHSGSRIVCHLLFWEQKQNV